MVYEVQYAVDFASLVTVTRATADLSLVKEIYVPVAVRSWVPVLS